MAEVKNAFIKSRMNKDLDDRLLPSGEYRNAINVQVSTSEGSDVGTVQNILGNVKITDFGDGVENLSSVGYLVDSLTNNIFVFLTDNAGEDYSPTANNFIYMFNPLSGISVTKLVEGAFLNFSKLYPISGINILESLLFWTDNRNQPRKINIKNPLGYYTTEDQISVAKYNPLQPIELWRESALEPGQYETTMLDSSSKFYPIGGICTLDGAITAQTSFSITGIDGDIRAGFPISYIDTAGVVNNTAFTVISYTAPTLVIDGALTLPNGTELLFYANPYYNPNYGGDPDFLQDKFVRFSYRFKFDDGEYSIFAPFTQPTFIPKQDGYFMYNEQITDPIQNVNDEEAAYTSTIVNFVKNKVTEIDLIIPLGYSSSELGSLPITKTSLRSELKIKSIDILYKESDGLAVQVVETITIDTIEGQVGTPAEVYVYTYQSQKPYKTLPSKELIRVYDKVPTKALAQEIISNRVVYGNFVNKPQPPASLDYNVAATPKSVFDLPTKSTSIIEYPNHSLKTNRSYQVGVVLADRFGRQSTVLLSNNKDVVVVDDKSYVGSTLFSPYIDEAVSSSAWPGNSLKIRFNAPILESVDPNTTYPGVYNGDTTSSSYNPLGWYSYKIVVKQTSQDYYNVYLPGIMAAYPDSITEEIGKTSHVVLINDNINKIPRDLSEVGPTQRQFRSSVKVFGRVENLDGNAQGYINTQFYPSAGSNIVSTIAGNNDLFNGEGLAPGIYIPSPEFYNIDSDPLIARISTNKKIGVVETGNVINLAVLETAADVSRLDIFWETASAGLISELNNAIAGEGGSILLSAFNSDSFYESISNGEEVLDDEFHLTDSLGAKTEKTNINSFVLTSVLNGSSANVTGYFIMTTTTVGLYDEYTIQVTQDFIDNIYYGSNAQLRTFTFNFAANIGVDNTPWNFVRTISLKNVLPTITLPNPCPSVITTTRYITVPGGAEQFKAINGSSSTLHSGKELTWSIIAQNIIGSPTQVNYFSIAGGSIVNGEYSATVTNTSQGNMPIGNYEVTVKVQDPGGPATLSCSLQLMMQAPVTEIREGYYSYWGYQSFVELQEPFVSVVVAGSLVNSQNGYYLYKGTMAELVSLNGGNSISIDVWNNPPTPPTCNLDPWVFSNTPFGVEAAWKNCFYPVEEEAQGFVYGAVLDINSYPIELIPVA